MGQLLTIRQCHLTRVCQSVYSVFSIQYFTARLRTNISEPSVIKKVLNQWERTFLQITSNPA